MSTRQQDIAAKARLQLFSATEARSPPRRMEEGARENREAGDPKAQRKPLRRKTSTVNAKGSVDVLTQFSRQTEKQRTRRMTAGKTADRILYDHNRHPLEGGEAGGEGAKRPSSIGYDIIVSKRF